jgi:hypothetical protein
MALSFATDIKPMFTSKDQEHMMFMFDLWNYDDVKSNASEIYDSVKEGRMPPGGSGGPWSPDKVSRFKNWMDEGCGP